VKALSGLKTQSLILIAVTVILACVAISLVSCGPKTPPPKEPDPVAIFFREILTALDSATAESVIVIEVDDPANAGNDIKRRVFNEIQTKLHDLRTIKIIEYPKSRIEAAFEQYGIVPSDGISPQDAMKLASEFNADALLYASIESKAPDVYIRLYSGQTGEVVFAKTLSKWQLPVTPDTTDSLDLFDLENLNGNSTDSSSGGN